MTELDLKRYNLTLDRTDDQITLAREARELTLDVPARYIGYNRVPVYNVKTYGAAGDGVADDTSAIHEAQDDAILTGGIVYFPEGVYAVSSPLRDVTDAYTIMGAGSRRTVLVTTAGMAGSYVLTYDNLNRNGSEQHSDTSLDYAADRAGVRLLSLTIASSRAYTAHGVQFKDGNDNVLFHDVTLAYFAGTAFNTAGDAEAFVRESRFDYMRIVGSGTVGSYPAANISIGLTAAASDGTNHITFTDCWFLYNRAEIKVTNTSATEVLRRVLFVNTMLHGDAQAATDPACDLLVLEGRLQNVVLRGLKTNGSHDVGGTKYATVRIRAAGGYTPQRIQISEYDQVTCDGDGIVVEDASGLRIEGMTAPSTIAGDDLRIEANAVQDAWVWLQGVDGSAPTVNIDSSVADEVYGFWGTTTFGATSLVGDLTVGDGNQILLPDGTVAAPGLAFTNDPDSGLILVNDGVVGQYIAGTRVASWEAALLRLQDGVNIATGTTSGLKIATSASQKIGLYGKTPVAQHSTTGQTAGHVAGASTAVTVDSTFTGGTGTKAYTLGDVVRALKNLGAMEA